MFPQSYIEVIQDLNVLCHVMDSSPNQNEILLDDVPFEDYQYCVQSRLVDLAVSHQALPITDPIYEACIFAAFMCVYMLSTGIWEGCFIPDFAAIKVLGCISEANHDPRWIQSKKLLLWLLVVTGGLTRKSSVKAMASMMIRSSFNSILAGTYDDWDELKCTLTTFIWSGNAMERHVRRFWDELRECY
jgi:hypothetical protein